MSDRLRRLVADLEAERPNAQPRRTPSAYYQPSPAGLPTSSSATALTNNGIKPFRFAETSQQLNGLSGYTSPDVSAGLRQLPSLSTRSAQSQPSSQFQLRQPATQRSTPPPLQPYIPAPLPVDYSTHIEQHRSSSAGTHASQPSQQPLVTSRAEPSHARAPLSEPPQAKAPLSRASPSREESTELAQLSLETKRLRTELQQAHDATASAEKHAHHLKEQLTRKQHTCCTLALAVMQSVL